MNRRIRGVIGTALTWGAGWAAVGLGVSGLRAVALRAADVQVPIDLWRFVALGTLRWAAFGLVAGTLFALALWYVGRRVGSLGALAPSRAAAWGLGAGVALPLCVIALLATGGAAVPLVAMFPLVITSGVFGAGTAAGTVALARRGPAPLAAGGQTTSLLPLSSRDDG